MSVCTFFGHRDCYGLDEERLYNVLEDLIDQGIDSFYVGYQGNFDALVYRFLRQLQSVYPHIHVAVVLASLPTKKEAYGGFSTTIFPEGLENVPPKFAIERRNKWMIEAADSCVCYVQHTWGGAYKFAKMAKGRGLLLINLGDVDV